MMDDNMTLVLVKKKKIDQRNDVTAPESEKKEASCGREYLTDESFSSCSEKMYENSKKVTELKNMEKSRIRFVRFYRVEGDESEEDESSIEKTESNVIVEDLNTFSPVRCKKSEKSPSRSPISSANNEFMFDSDQKGNGEKKVPLAPRNKTKIMFNFEKGYLAERSEKPTKTLPVVTVGIPAPSLTDQLTLRISSIKQTKKSHLKMAALDIDLCEKENGNATTAVSKTYRDEAFKELEDKINEKDLMIEKLRREVSSLNLKNEDLVSQVHDLRMEMESLQAQFKKVVKIQVDQSDTDVKIVLPSKHISKTLPDQSAFKEGLAYSSLQMKEKNAGIHSTSKFSSTKKFAQAINTGTFKRPGVMMLTPKGINKISFHSKIKSMTSSDFIKEKIIKANYEEMMDVNTSNKKALLQTDKSDFGYHSKKLNSATSQSGSKKLCSVVSSSPPKYNPSIELSKLKSVKDTGNKSSGKFHYNNKDQQLLRLKTETRDLSEQEDFELATRIKNKSILSGQGSKSGLGKKSLDLTGGLTFFERTANDKSLIPTGGISLLTKHNTTSMKSSLHRDLTK